MTEPVQSNVNVNFSNVSSVVLSFGSAVVAGHTIIVQGAGQPGSSADLISAVVDNKSNTSPGYSLVVKQAFTPQGNTSGCWSQEGIATGGSGFQLTITLGAAGSFGLMGIYESAQTTRDQHGASGDAGSTATSANITSAATNTGTTDFVCTAICINGGANPSALSHPPSGYTVLGSELDGTIAVIAQASYRTNSSAVQDVAAYSWVADGAQGWGGTIASWYTPAGGNVTVALTGQAATFAAGTLAPGSSLALTGQKATFSPGSLGLTLGPPLVGQAATFTPGTLSPSSTVPVVGQGATFTPGNLTPGLSFGLLGSSATFSPGSMAPAFSIPLTGQRANFHAGTMVSSGGTPIGGTQPHAEINLSLSLFRLGGHSLT